MSTVPTLLINDTLQSRQISLAELANSFRGYQSTPNIPNKKALLMTLDDPHKIEVIPGKYESFCDYDYSKDANPLSSYYRNREGWAPWEITFPANSGAAYGELYGNMEVEAVLPNLGNCFHLNDGTSDKPATYFYSSLSDSQKEALLQTGTGYCDFEIAIPWIWISHTNNGPTSDNESYPQDPAWGGWAFGSSYLKTGGSNAYNNKYANELNARLSKWDGSGNDKYSNQETFIGFGPYSQDQSKRFQFACVFRLYYNGPTTTNGNSATTADQYDTYIHFDRYDGTEVNPRGNTVNVALRDSLYAEKIEGWNGTTFKKFRFEYYLDATNNMRGRLYLYNTSSNTWVMLREGIKPVTYGFSDDHPGACMFGVYSQYGQGQMAIRSISFHAYRLDQYKVKADSVLYETPSEFITAYQNLYTYSLTGDSSVTANWGFLKNTNTFDVLEPTTHTFSTNWVTTLNTTTFTAFNLKNKLITFFINGDITEFINPSKNISRLNLTDFPNLITLDVRGNKLTSIDLSQNKKLVSIDVSNNPSLTDIKLPTEADGSNYIEILDLRNTQVKTIEFIGVGRPLDLRFSFNSNLTKLTIQNVELTADSITTLNPSQFPSLELVNISQTNILTNKSTLETFLSNLPSRTGKSSGIVYLYGPKYTVNSVQGCDKDIANTLSILQTKNWIFYL